MRHAFIFAQRSLGSATIFPLIKQAEAYAALPRKVSNDILRQVDKNWRAFFAAGAADREDPSKFVGRPKLPKYTDKTTGRFLLLDEKQAMSRTALQRGMLAPSGLASEVQTAQRCIKQARMVPRIGFSVVAIVSEQPEHPPQGTPALHAAVDLGVDTLAAIPSNTGGFSPRRVNGRPLKSTQQVYTKRSAELQTALGHAGTPARLERLTNKRTRRSKHSLHAASKTRSEVLVQEGIGTRVIGKTLRWNQERALGRVTTQPVVQIPHARFSDLLSYQAG